MVVKEVKEVTMEYIYVEKVEGVGGGCVQSELEEGESRNRR